MTSKTINPIEGNKTHKATFGKDMYFDKHGYEIRNGDIIRVPHFKIRRRQYYMWKIVHFLESWGGWVCIHSGEQFALEDKRNYNLESHCHDDRGSCPDIEIVSRDVCFNALNNRRKRLFTPPLTQQ